MTATLHTAPEINKAADNVFLWLSLYLFMACVTLYKVGRSIFFAKSDEEPTERLSASKKVFFGFIVLFGLQIALYASSDILLLCTAFPPWGGLIVVLLLSILWIAGCFFLLNQESVGEYTINADQRVAIDKMWEQQLKRKLQLQRLLLAWIGGDGLAILWLMSLTHKSWRSLFSFLLERN